MKVELLEIAPSIEDVGTDVVLVEGSKDVAVEFLEAVEKVRGDLIVEDKRPLQKPSTQVLNAHCSSQVQEAWKLPQTEISIELTA